MVYRMLFDPFESVVLFLSVIIVNQTLSDGKVCLALKGVRALLMPLIADQLDGGMDLVHGLYHGRRGLLGTSELPVDDYC